MRKKDENENENEDENFQNTPNRGKISIDTKTLRNLMNGDGDTPADTQHWNSKQ